MTPNEAHLTAARHLLGDFERSLEVAHLEEAVTELGEVRSDLERPSERPIVRAATLALWLDIFALVDKHLDPAFDPQKVPDKQVAPPPGPGGVKLRPGAPPSAIADPQARAAYEEAIEAHRIRLQSYRLQVYLHRFEESLSESFEMFLRGAYDAKDEKDLTELRGAFGAKIKSEARRAALEELLRP